MVNLSLSSIRLQRSERRSRGGPVPEGHPAPRAAAPWPATSLAAAASSVHAWGIPTGSAATSSPSSHDDAAAAATTTTKLSTAISPQPGAFFPLLLSPAHIFISIPPFCPVQAEAELRLVPGPRQRRPDFPRSALHSPSSVFLLLLPRKKAHNGIDHFQVMKNFQHRF